MDALNKALNNLEHNLNQGEYMVECAGTVSNKIVGAYLELNDEYQREYFGHEHAKRAQVIAEQHIKEALERLEAAHGCLMEVFDIIRNERDKEMAKVCAALRNAESEEKEGDA